MTGVCIILRSKGVVLALRDGLTWEAQLGESLQEGNCLGISGGSKASKALSQGDVEDDNKDNDKVLKLWTLNYHQQMCFTKFSPIFIFHFGRVDSKRKVFSSQLCWFFFHFRNHLPHQMGSLSSIFDWGRQYVALLQAWKPSMGH